MERAEILELTRRLTQEVQLERRASRASQAFVKTRNELMEIDQAEERTNCQESTVVEVAVHLSVEEVSLVALHAQNDSYPVFSLQVEQWDMDYRELHDHDEFSIKLGAFRLCDTTNYPNTLDPRRSYGVAAQLHEQEVLSASDSVAKRSMLELSLTSFHFP